MNGTLMALHSPSMCPGRGWTVIALVTGTLQVVWTLCKLGVRGTHLWQLQLKMLFDVFSLFQCCMCIIIVLLLYPDPWIHGFKHNWLLSPSVLGQAWRPGLWHIFLRLIGRVLAAFCLPSCCLPMTQVQAVAVGGQPLDTLLWNLCWLSSAKSVAHAQAGHLAMTVGKPRMKLDQVT